MHTASATKSLMEMLPRYKRVRVEIEKFLSSFDVGKMIPTENELTKKFGVSRVTMRKALEDLRAEGFLESHKGKGTFLVKKPPTSSVTHRKVVVGVLLPSMLSPSLARIFSGIDQEAEKNGFQVLLSHNDGDPIKQIFRLKEMSRQGVDGILIYPSGSVTEEREFLKLLCDLQKKKQNIIFVDRYVAGYDHFPCVMSDNVGGMYAATEHLILQGRRKPALLGFWKKNTAHAERREGFFNALRAYKIPTKGIMESETGLSDNAQHAYEIVTEWIQKNRDFDSIVCMTDPIAHGAFMALRNSGVRVPEDIALIGYDNEDSGLYRAMGLRLTSVQQPLEKIGIHAVRKLKALLQGEKFKKENLHTLLKARLIARTSCGEK